MGVTWTEDQKKVIDLRNRNILVSAAAGSGKTAVLVERIMEIICDERHPVDVDRLLVVTFTKAAAAEMKERVGAAIRKRLELQPNNGYLQKQETLVHHAQITTIDSFCAYILRNHFGEIDLDPAFRVADEGELKLLKKDVLKEILEEEYENQRPEFLHFVECYASGKSDEVLEELILKLYEFSMSDPFPEKWLEESKKEDLEKSEYEIPDHVTYLLESLLEETKSTIELCRSPGGPVLYEDALLADRKMLSDFLEAKTYEECAELILERKFQALSRKKMAADVQEEKKEAVKVFRNRMKKNLENLEKQFFFVSPKLLYETEKTARPVQRELIDLTLEFSRRFAEKKKKRNVVDFSDIEHFALKILVKEEDGQCVPTEVAKGYAEYFSEIMIDEYQDSNLVQELILTSISKELLGGSNLFMVGDVKQSIYRFRQARPELFMEKQERYTLEESSSQRVNLSKNFRSRKEVLETVNYLFERMMMKKLGNICYDEEAALYPGASMPEPEKPEDVQSELLLLELSEKETDEKTDKAEQEASMIAGKILNLLENTKVTDKKTGQLRKAVPADIVILLRTMSGWSDTFANVLGDYGIETVTGSSTGYFSAPEVRVMLNFLRILDNQKQDIPLCAVLHSVIGNISSSEMAQIRSEFLEIPFYEAAIRYGEEGRNEVLCRKLLDFWKMIKELRNKAEYLPIHKLLWEIYDRTSFEQFVRMQPNGEVRKANLQMLIQKALDYENTSYRGLFNFVRYIENLQKYEIDYGMAQTGTENENAVQIMSIHKSKGLEFPIVFVAGLGKKFNKQDARERIAMHPRLGIALDAIDPENRRKLPTLEKRIIQKQVELESLGEELRVLYVALTRAKEKLIMTGVLKNAAEELKKLSEESHLCRREIYESLCGGSCFLDWIVQACAGEQPPFSLNIVSVESLVRNKVAQMLEQTCDYTSLRLRKTEPSEVLKNKFSYGYPYEEQLEIQGKVSVSELKRAAVEEDVRELFEEPEIVPYVPEFLREVRGPGAAERGTAYHKIVEIMDLSGIRHSDQVRERVEALVKEGYLSAETAAAVNAYEIYLFCQSSLCRRILEAKTKGRLYREQPFVIARPVKEVYPEKDFDQEILVQGIIDVYFEEDGQYVIADYKTDRVKTETELMERYKTQLQIYGDALEQITGKKVKEKILYSFCLGKEIFV